MYNALRIHLLPLTHQPLPATPNQIHSRTMSAIVLPPSTLTLTQWAQQHLTELYQATDEATLDAAYAAFLAPDASITVNGTRLSGDAYKAQLLLPSRGAQVAYSGAVEVPDDAGRPSQV